MALVVKDRVKETTTSTGTGTITLAGATQGYQSFSVIGNANTTFYTITDGTNFEVGIGTYTATGTTLSRDTVLESSNSGSLVDFPAGTKDVFVTYPAEKSVTLDGTETLTNKTIDASNNTITNVDLTSDVTGTLPIANGGTNATTAAGALTSLGAYAATNPDGYTTNTGTVTSVATSGTVNGLTLTGGPITGSGTVTLGGTLAISNADWSGADLSVANGGTGQSSYTNGQLLIGNTTGNTLAKATLTAGTNVSITNGAGSITINSTDQYSGTVTSVGGTGTVNGLTLSGTVTTSGNLTLGGTLAISNDDWSGTDLSVANGGTGASSLTSGYLLKGNGTSAVSASVVYDDGTNIGVGTALPAQKIHAANAGTTYVRAENTTTGVISDFGTNSTGTTILNRSDTPIVFYTNTTERMRLDSTGLGIGTSSPSSKLHLSGAATADARATFTQTTAGLTGQIQQGSTGFAIAANGSQNMLFETNGSERVRVDSSGNVGIGTSSPSARLDVAGDVALPNNGILNFKDTGGVNRNSLQFLSGELRHGGAGAGLSSQTFYTSGSERMRINSSGNVGIGTSSPSTSQLHVYTNTDNAYAARFDQDHATGWGVLIDTDATVNTDPALWVKNATDTIMWAGSGGNVGVGTSSPSAKLTVSSGDILLSNAYSLKGRNAADTLSIGMMRRNASDQVAIDEDGYGTVIGSGGVLGVFGSGNVGIGTSSPSDKLNISSSSNQIGLDTGDQATYGTLDLGHFTNGAFIGTQAGSNSASNLLRFGTSGTERMRIDSSGTVTIQGDLNTSNNDIFLNDGWLYFQDAGQDQIRLNGNGEQIDFYNQTDSKYANIRVGRATGDIDFRAPLYYDQNNTTYYADFGSTTVSLKTNGPIMVNSTTSPLSYASHFATSSTSIQLTFERTTTNAGQGGIGADINNCFGAWNSSTVNMFRVTQGGAAFASDSFRAPIFYDSDNTSYYLDAASTSTSLHAAGIVEAEGSVRTPSLARLNGTEAIALNNATYTQIKNPSGTIKLWVGNNNYNYYNNDNHIFRNTASTTSMSINSSGVVTATGDFRAPIFYDSGNTSFYVNPDGTSNCNDIKAENLPYAKAGSAYGTENTFVTDGGVGADNITRSMFYRDNNNQFGALGVNITHATSTAYALQIACSSYSNNTGTFKFRLKNAGTWTGATTLIDDGSANQTKSGILQSSTDIRAPIFYDRNNTSYYIDGASTSKLNFGIFDGPVETLGVGTFDPTATGAGSDTSTTVAIGIPRGKRIVGTATGYIRNMLEWRDGDAKLYLGQTGTALIAGIRLEAGSSGHTEATISMRAPLFYDSDDTSRYLNPASESVINTLNLFGELNLSAATNYIDHTGTITFRNQSGFATSATLTTSGNFTATGNVTAYSDLRVKDNVEQIDGALDRIRHVRGVTYNRTDLENKDRRYGGVIAQELEEVLPEAVFDHGDKKSVDYNATIGLLIEAVKELKAEVDELRRDAVTVKHKGN